MAKEDFEIFDAEDDVGGDFFEEDKKESSQLEATSDANVQSEVVNKPTSSVLDSNPSLPQLCGDGYPSAYVDMVKRVHDQYLNLPSLDYDAIYAELCTLTVECRPSPSLQVINAEIQKVQAVKDRVTTIYVDVTRNYFFKKRAVDILKDSWGRFTTEKNAEKRKGDSAFRLSGFEVDFARVEALYKAVIHIVKNLDSLHDGLSRRITVYQSLLKLHDMGRGGLPDIDFNGGSFNTDEDDDVLEEIEDVDPTEGPKPKLEDF